MGKSKEMDQGMDVVERLKRMENALELEKQADQERHRAIIEEHSLHERRKKGWTWHPVVPVDYGYTFGDKAYVEIERQGDTDAHHQFRSGQPVRLYVEEEGAQDEVAGVVHFVRDGKMKIVLYDEDYPDWITGHSLAVEQLFDARTYKSMQKAIDRAKEARGRFLYLLERLFGLQKPATIEEESSLGLSNLNSSQSKAVNAMIDFEDILVLHGPPGTGKTTTLVEGIFQLVKRGQKILVSASSNTAVDVMAERLSERNLRVLRLGNISRVDRNILDLTLDGQLAREPESKKVKQLKVEAAAIRRKASTFKRNFGAREREERKEMYREAREIQQWANQLEQTMIYRLVEGAEVICCTLINTDQKLLRDIDFDVTVIDEAGQALDPGLLIPLRKSRKWIMAGDPFQLPPTVKSKEAERKGLAENMLERWINSDRRSFFLTVQYRMHREIMEFPNRYFYQGRLQADVSVADRKLALPEYAPVEFIDTAGCGFEEQINEENKSRYNEGEAFILREHFLQLIQAAELAKIPFPDLGIITPYREQVRYLRKFLAEDEQISAFQEYYHVDSIDGFQGNEKTVIYISMVRSNDRGEIGFLKDYRRMNVALTRAREKLILIGDSSTLGTDTFYSEWLDLVEEKNDYRSAWEFMTG
jgi:superfamily I DNA and/or RNA helicase